MDLWIYGLMAGQESFTSRGRGRGRGGEEEATNILAGMESSFRDGWNNLSGRHGSIAAHMETYTYIYYFTETGFRSHTSTIHSLLPHRGDRYNILFMATIYAI